MTTYRAPLDDVRFVLHDVLDAGRLAGLAGLQDATPDVVDAVLDQAARLAETVLFPLNQTGDAEGCTYDNGVVRTPAGFPQAYATYIAGGWTSVTADPCYGGQGLPALLNFVVDEFMTSANMALAMVPGLSHGAYHAIAAHGDDALKATYLPKLADGTWTGTMCLTEPQCGSDLGLIRSKAVPAGDGSFRISGTKIFITAGEHDLAETIVHLVLARLPDAPPGTRGVSMFLVPKHLPVDDGGATRPGARNGVVCTGIETKMGIHGSPTCTLVFDEATGWLVGAPHKGMRAMFTMMNDARLAVGIQGLGVGELAYQNALAYARERRQGRVPGGRADDGVAADPIIDHADIRRMLMTMKAQLEGGRALAYWTALHVDLASRHPDPARRRAADDLVALMTPVVKAHLTDLGQDIADLAIQVHGGYGYIRETGIEQLLRDARIARIYEGTNGIQALDLVGRKLGEGAGRLLRQVFHPIDAFLADHRDDPVAAPLTGPLAKAFGRLQLATGLIARTALKDPSEATAAAHDYLKLLGLVTVGWLWARMALAARAKAGGPGADARFLDAKVKTATFYMQHILPQAAAHAAAIAAGAGSVMALDADAF
ncbi:MAG: acyl-CoA dehydrogenase C-terminal domain-containing protein [Rhodospirillaceae bacterium]|nr:acyl-CoA dehydrogenase C-terminal domain-containing protein [Rhodospirillaceae bacterium]